MDFLLGVGVEILADWVCCFIFKGKCGGQEWFDIMYVAYNVGLIIFVMMMFGYIEINWECMDYLVCICEVQFMKLEGVKGFIVFIFWLFQDEDIIFKWFKWVCNICIGDEYVCMIVMSWIMLFNIMNIQVFWLMVGKQVVQFCFYVGANDFGFIMIEENVVFVVGVCFCFIVDGIQEFICEVGYIL